MEIVRDSLLKVAKAEHCLAIRLEAACLCGTILSFRVLNLVVDGSKFVELWPSSTIADDHRRSSVSCRIWVRQTASLLSFEMTVVYGVNKVCVMVTEEDERRSLNGLIEKVATQRMCILFLACNLESVSLTVLGFKYGRLPYVDFLS